MITIIELNFTELQTRKGIKKKLFVLAIDRKNYRVFLSNRQLLSKQIIRYVQLTHKFDLYLHTRGCREVERNFLDI